MDTITIDDFFKVEIKVGKVLDAVNKEGSEKLIRLTVDIGPSSAKAMEGEEEREIRTIFTAVRPFGYSPEDFIGKQFLFITNLEYKKIMDEESQGMILAVDDEMEGKPLFISADGLPIGSAVR